MEFQGFSIQKKKSSEGRASVLVRLEIFALGVITKEFELVGGCPSEWHKTVNLNILLWGQRMG